MTSLPLVVSPEWLFDHLNYPNLIIVDCRFQLSDSSWGYQQYLLGHLPNAVYLDLNRDLSSVVTEHGGRHPLPSLTQITEVFNRIGITAESTIIAYDSSRFAFASRLWWLLRYLGHSQVALLDGGWSAWQKEQYPITTAIPSPKSGNFQPNPQSDWVVDIETVKARKDLPSVVLVDSRESDRYLGVREPIDPIAGSIVGAVNSPWQEVTTENGYLQPLTKQKRLWEKYENAEEIIVYCGSGVTACVNLLSLELSGFKQTKLYPGGWSDWCSYQNDVL